MKEFERVLETYMPLVITTTLRNMLPVLISTVGCGEKGQPETTVEHVSGEEGATAENEHDA